MRAHCRTLIAVAVATSLIGSWQAPSNAQLRLLPIADQQGTVALGLMLRKLQSVGTLLMTTAHPDDENNGMLASVGMGLGWRTVLFTATRGDGGQNEIGPELFDALAVLRTEELLAAHRFDGAEQYFSRAVDFGYSFSIDETFKKWGKDEILGDFVRMLRTIRPDVVVGFAWDGRGGGQHHQASARLTAEAFRAAADPARYPEQIKEGLRPWQARKFYYTSGFGPRPDPSENQSSKKLLPFDSNSYDSLLGRSYAEISAEARSMHKCQGMGQVLALPGSPDVRRYVLQDTTLEGGVERPDPSVVDGVETSLASLASYAGANPPQALTDALAAITTDIVESRKVLFTDGAGAATKTIASGLKRLRELQKALSSFGMSDDAVYEIAFRLTQKERQFEQALMYAAGLRVDVIADDGLVVPGQKVNVTVRASARGSDGSASVRSITLQGLGESVPCGGGPVANDKVFECKLTGAVPADAKPTTPYFRRLPDAARYAFDSDAPFGLPFRPTPFRASINLAVGSQPFALDLPVQYRYEGNIFSGEKRMELHVVPAMAVSLTPEIAVVPIGPTTQRTAASASAAGGRELRVSVINHAKGPATGQARLTVPSGWGVTPASIPVSFSREDESVTVRFRLMPSARQEGDFDVQAVVRAGDRDYGDGYQVIEYPHTQRRHVVEPAQTRVKVLDVKVPAGLTVGYVMGVGDLVPPAIEQLGARVELLTADDLAWGNLSKYDAIVTGVRAYERRQDLRANNHRLIEYATGGGTLIVQYNKFEFNDAQFGPYPAKVSSNRVTDEGAAMTALIPEHPVFRLPNKIEASAWDGWVQERGLYFLGERAPQYTDLVESADTFEYNAGAKRGALVEAKVGKGRWIYVGLNLWRQLPAGTPGAYRLMANLISLGKQPVTKAAND